MKSLLSSVALSALVAILPAWSQTTAPATGAPSNEQNAPGTGGTSKPGTPGLPGSKSGPAAGTSSGTSVPDATSSPATSKDEGKVPGLPGGKSGPAAKPAPGATDDAAGGTKSR